MVRPEQLSIDRPIKPHSLVGVLKNQGGPEDPVDPWEDPLGLNLYPYLIMCVHTLWWGMSSVVSVYWQTWSSSWVDDPEKLDLVVGMKDGVNIVNLAFADPNMKDVDGFRNTGLQFNQDFLVVKAGIQILRKRGIRVMLSVGGGSYPFAKGYTNAKVCCKLASDLGCDGVDIDWEPQEGAAVDNEFAGLITQFKYCLWPGALLTAAVWSVGAAPKGEGGSLFAGMNIKGLQSAGMNLDWINLMAYDAGKAYRVVEAFQQYRRIFKGSIMIGLEVGTQAWGGALLSNDDVVEALKIVNDDGVKGNGVFVWAYQKECGGTPSVEYIVGKAAEGKVTVEGDKLPEWKVMITCPACAYNIKCNYA